jgi:spore germination protein
MAISYDSAIELAYDNNAVVEYDEITNTAYFQFILNDEYMVRFYDARSIDRFVKLVPDYGLHCATIWNIMNWFPQTWMVINSQYDIDKVM